MTRPYSSPAASLLFGSLGFQLMACASSLPPSDFERQAEPDPAAIDAVVFLVGDAGLAEPGRSPLLSDLRDRVDRWSRALSRDSAVQVIFLGDNVYPDGVRARPNDGLWVDSLRLRAQVDVVATSAAVQFRSTAHFLAGNHDWGENYGPEGLAILQNQAALLSALRGVDGPSVGLTPAAGEPGPTVVDIGATARLLLLDTDWWFQPQTEETRARVGEELQMAMAGGGQRSLIVAAHHPMVSGGEHGGARSPWTAFGLAWLIAKTGSLSQDLNSAPYRELVDDLRMTFGEVGPPLVFAGGHDHSLQVIRGSAPNEPRWSLVSGAGSKTTHVRDQEGMRFGREWPGFMRLTFLDDGSVLLHVFAIVEGEPICLGEGAALDRCMEQGPGSIRSVFEERLR